MLKSRIFLCLIVGICCLGIGVYGANTYKANTIKYTPSDGSEGIDDVDAALNDLYKKVVCTSMTCKMTSKVSVGDYVKMTPTSTSYTISEDLTGYSDNQIINPSELNLWRIIDINNDGTIEIISENVSSKDVSFKGKTGYLKFVGTLNTIASQYENSKYTIGSRIMGYNRQTATITDTSKFTTTAPWTSSTSDSSNETLGGGDIMYVIDTSLVENALGTLVATTPSEPEIPGTATSYWIGSRRYLYNSSTNYYWRGRYIDTSGSSYSAYLYRCISSSWSSSSGSYAIRPILTLKSGLTATGSGTSEDPWVLE